MGGRAVIAGLVLAVLMALGSQQSAAAGPEDPVARARVHLAQEAGSLGLRADLTDLVTVDVRKGLAGEYVRFQQTFGGVPIAGASVVVTLPANGDEQPSVNSRYQPGLSPPPVQARSSSADALLTALGSLGASAGNLRGDPSVDAAYFRDGRDRILGWQVVLPLSEPLGTWLVAIRASDGSVLFTSDLLSFDSGQIFDPNPAKSSGGSIPPPTDCDNASNEALLSGQYVNPTLQGIDAGQNKLKGEFVDLTAPGIVGAYKLAGQADEPSRTYTYDCTDDRFEEVMVYSHVDTLQRKIQSLGYSGSSGIIDRPIPAHAHYFDDCNAFYDPVDRGIHFGDGDICTFKTDAAEDADVIVHEYGHAIQHDQVPGWGFGSASEAEQAWAMGEGFSDFLAAAIFGDPCLSEWFSFGGACLRTLENSSQYPADFEDCRPKPPQPAEPHCAGLIWGGALWDLTQALGDDQGSRDTVLTLVLESHFSLDPVSTFAEAAAAIRQADVLVYNGNHVATIDSVFSARGISSLGAVSDFPYAYLRIRHPFNGDLDVHLLVGSTSSPVCTVDLWEPSFVFGSADLVGYQELTPSSCSTFLPPTSAQPWYLEVGDVFAGLTGTLEEFEVVLLGSDRCIATDVPIAIPDNDGFVYSMVDCSTIVGSGAGDDVDGDGFSAAVETYLGTDPWVRCGEGEDAGPSSAWPLDFASGGILESTDQIDGADVLTFLAPVRRLNTSPGDPAFSQRWDLIPGPNFPFPTHINAADILAMLAGADNGPAKPPMFGGSTRAINGPACTDAP